MVAASGVLHPALAGSDKEFARSCFPTTQSAPTRKRSARDLVRHVFVNELTKPLGPSQNSSPREQEKCTGSIFFLTSMFLHNTSRICVVPIENEPNLTVILLLCYGHVLNYSSMQVLNALRWCDHCMYMTCLD